MEEKRIADTGETGKGGEIRQSQRNRGETGQLDVFWLFTYCSFGLAFAFGFGFELEDTDFS